MAVLQIGRPRQDQNKRWLDLINQTRYCSWNCARALAFMLLFRKLSEETIKMTQEKQNSRENEVGGLVFVGCLLIGLALGFLMGNVAVGVFGGLGVGFIAMAIVRFSTGQW